MEEHGDNRGAEVPHIVFEKESYASLAIRKCRTFFRNITLEPVMLFYGVVRSIDGIANNQLLLDKTCLNDFDFGEEICNDLVNHKENNTVVQNEVAQYQVYESIVDHLFPVIFSFFLGSWSDSFGRKWLLYLYFVICIIQTGGLMLNSYFMEWPKEFLLFSVNLPVALSGGHITFSMGIAAFITEISTPEQRTFRLATVHFVEGMGGPLGTLLGAYLWEVGGYLCVFGTSLVGKVLTLAFLVIRLEMFQWKPGRIEDTEERPKRRNALSLSHIKDSFETCFKKRENGKRFYLLIYTCVMLTIVLPFFGEMTIGYNYVRTRYDWSMVEFSNYRSICSVIDLIGQGVLIPLIGYLNIKDSNIIPVIICTIISRHVIKGLAYEPWLMYVGSAVDLLGRYSFSAARSATSKCVEMHELGKVFALLYSIESLVPMAMTQIYASLWKATSTVPGIGETLWVGACFFLSAIVSGFGLILSIVAWIRLGGRDIGELDVQESKAPSYRPNRDI